MQAQSGRLHRFLCEHRRRLGERGRQPVERESAGERMIRETQDLHTEVLAEASGRSERYSRIAQKPKVVIGIQCTSGCSISAGGTLHCQSQSAVKACHCAGRADRL